MNFRDAELSDHGIIWDIIPDTLGGKNQKDVDVKSGGACSNH
jgi:hypothetical protein